MFEDSLRARSNISHMNDDSVMDLEGKFEMIERLDELEGILDNIMTDEEVKEAHLMIDEIRHKVRNDEPGRVPALEGMDAHNAAIIESALMRGQVTRVKCSTDPMHHKSIGNTSPQRVANTRTRMDIEVLIPSTSLDDV